MHVHSESVDRLRQEFRERLQETVGETGIMQKELADACGVNQSTIHRWISYSGDIDFPAALVPALSKGALRQVGLAILGWQAGKMGMEVRPVRATGQSNGSIVDETLALTDFLGKLAHLVSEGNIDYRDARRRLEQIRDKSNEGLLEIERLEMARLQTRPAR